MRDGFGRSITYLRLFVADRCNLRCIYCLPEQARFLPRDHLLDISELERLARAFVRLGVRTIRLTGGEPLVRKGVLELVAKLGELIGSGFDELTLTTNGVLLAGMAEAIARAGVCRN